MRSTTLSLLCAALVAAAGCETARRSASAPTEAAHVPSKPLRFIFIAPVIHEEFFLPVRKGMADAAKMMGVEAVFTGTEGVDAKAQATMVTKAVEDGYDGIAVDIIDPVAFDEAVKSALDKGMPVVAFNTDDSNSPNARLSTVSQNLYQAGRTVGAEALKFIPPNSKVLITMHDAGVSALEDRARGIQDELKQKGIAWKIIIASPVVSKAEEIIAQALKENPDIKVVLCTGQADTEAAGLVLEKHYQGKGDATAGFDLSPNILRLVSAGVIRFTIDQQPYAQGFYPVIQLTLLCRYGIKPTNIDAGAFLITKEQAEGVMRWKKLHYR